jgi:thiol-disulfide isomerase/thioredoxin
MSIQKLKFRRASAFRFTTMLLIASCFCGCSSSTPKMPSWVPFAKAKTEPTANSAATTEASEVKPASAAMPARLTAIGKEISQFQSFPFTINQLDVHGRPLRLENYLGKVVVVDVFGTWCGPCRRVIPHLVQVQSKHANDVQVIGLCNERTADVRMATNNLNAMIGEFGINYPCGLIDDSTLRRIPNFGGYPTVLFIDRTGKVRITTVGVKPDSYWDSIIAELVAEPATTGSPVDQQPIGRVATRP